MMEAERLDSDRVLFLIWRFLLESNFRESAAKLQKEWQVAQPHRHFSFARHVKTHALVALLHRGLQHQALEREFLASDASHDSAADISADLPLHGVFGPLVTGLAYPLDDDDEDEEEEDDDDDDNEEDDEMVHESEVSRKRPADRRQSSPAKRQKLLSNGYSNGAIDSATLAMDVDHIAGEPGQAYPSPLEGDQIPTPVPRTDGPAVSTQVDTVKELTAETVFLRLSNEDPSEPTAENLPMLMHCQWNPQDPTLIAAAGSDALARVWTICTPDHVSPPHVSPASELILSNRDIPTHADVTAMAWNNEGGQIAIATQFDGRAKVTIYDLNSTVMRDWELPEPPVIKVKWNAQDTFILAISPDDKGSLLTVCPVLDDSSAKSPTFFIPHDLEKEPLDATWCTETEFLICGGTTLKSLHFVDSRISLFRKFETREDDQFTHVQYDPVTKLVATASEKGHIDIWREDGQRKTISAHVGQVTALMWQPIHGEATENERLLASAGEDGAIMFWNARKPEEKNDCPMTMGLPIVALSFTPDGVFIAGATSQKVLIWKVGDRVMPRASWSRVPHPGWESPKAPESESVEDIHCLGWDSNGQKLAYGVNSRLAVITFVPGYAVDVM